MVGLREFGTIDKDGNEIKDFKYPWKLIFQPVYHMPNEQEFTEEGLQKAFVEIPANTHLYDI